MDTATNHLTLVWATFPTQLGGPAAHASGGGTYTGHGYRLAVAVSCVALTAYYQLRSRSRVYCEAAYADPLTEGLAPNGRLRILQLDALRKASARPDHPDRPVAAVTWRTVWQLVRPEGWLL
ncbi:hypothetical protein IWQ60_012480, partial [Tieghemiomyces parasiticus]